MDGGRPPSLPGPKWANNLPSKQLSLSVSTSTVEWKVRISKRRASIQKSLSKLVSLFCTQGNIMWSCIRSYLPLFLSPLLMFQRKEELETPPQRQKAPLDMPCLFTTMFSPSFLASLIFTQEDWWWWHLMTTYAFLFQALRSQASYRPYLMPDNHAKSLSTQGKTDVRLTLSSLPSFAT